MFKISKSRRIQQQFQKSHCKCATQASDLNPLFDINAAVSLRADQKPQLISVGTPKQRTAVTTPPLETTTDRERAAHHEPRGAFPVVQRSEFNPSLIRSAAKNSTGDIPSHFRLRFTTGTNTNMADEPQLKKRLMGSRVRSAGLKCCMMEHAMAPHHHDMRAP